MPTVTKGFGAVIAERTLVVGDRGTRTVVVSLGTPRPSDLGEDEWECPFRIKGAGLAIVEFGRGVDAMQALITALQGIRYFLDKTGLALSWDGLPVHIAFPRSLPPSLHPTFTRRLERLVDRELARHVRALKARHKRGMARRKK